MTENLDYIYVLKSDVNEGLTSLTVTKAALFFTKKYIFIIPFESTNIVGIPGLKEKYDDIHQYINELISRMKEIHIEDFENEMKTILPKERIFEFSSLEKFEIKVGFGIFGGLSLKTYKQEKKGVNIQPKKKRQQIRDFYKIQV